MGKRMDALWRIVAFVWAIFVGSIIAGLATLVGIVWGALDVLWQLVTGGDGLSSGSMWADLVTEPLQWYHDQLIYSFTGSGSFQLFPRL